jgi:hypothetical protein
VEAAGGARVASPAARFLQWRATLAASGGAGPALKLVEVAYQQKNVAPVLERVEATPYNYKFPGAPLIGPAPPAPNSITLPAIGQPRRESPAPPASEPAGAMTLTHEAGWMGARWKASDVNGDALEFKLEYRGVNERAWKLVKDHLRDNRFSWDATGWAEGRYVLRVTASDEPDNYAADALSATLESEPFLIDNTAPVIEPLEARLEGATLVIRFTAADALSDLDSAEYSINGAAWRPARPTTGITDSPRHDYVVEAPAGAGDEWTVAVRVSDAMENQAVRKVTVRR